MQDKIIIIGAGGHAKVIADIILKAGESLSGFLDDNAEGQVLGLPILGTLSDISKYCSEHSFVIGIGNNQIRKQIDESYDVTWYTAIHPTAIIARDVSIAAGTVVMAGAIINPSATVGRHCIINTGVIVEHDNRIGDYVHLSPHATLCGTVTVGELTHVGAGVTVKNNTTVCAGCVIGAGAAVVSDITEAGTYVGVPARKIK